MKTVQEAQELLLNWFKIQSVKSHSTTKINYLCQELNSQLELELLPKRVYYKIFMPLVRLGLIDYSNVNRLSLAPAIFLQNSTSIIGLNIPTPFLKKIKEEEIDFIFFSFFFHRM